MFCGIIINDQQHQLLGGSVLDLTGKIALVTGGASGIGAACAKMLAKQGAHVAVIDLNLQNIQPVVDAINSAGGKAIALSADVSNEAAIAKAVTDTTAQLEGLHIAVNCAGIGGNIGPLADQTAEDWRRVLAVNLDGVFYSMRHEIPAILKSGGGSIINIASVFGQLAFANSSGYVAAKHGVVGLSKNAAIEYATQGIRVNSVGPSSIRTPLLSPVPSELLEKMTQLHPVKRLGEPEEVAAVVTFLASDEASFVTGSHYTVDGGYSAQ